MFFGLFKCYCYDNFNYDVIDMIPELPFNVVFQLMNKYVFLSLYTVFSIILCHE